MKKLLLLLAVLFTVNYAFANESMNPKEGSLYVYSNGQESIMESLSKISTKNEIFSTEMILNNECTQSVEVENTKELRCLTVHVTCTSAYTCQDWTFDQWLNWANQIQYNYCTLGGKYVFTTSSGTED